MRQADIRTMMAADVPWIRRLSARYRPSVAQRYQRLWNAGRFKGMYVITLDRSVAGFGCLSFPTPTEAWIEGLVVEKKLRGRGLGTDLGRRLLDEATVKGARVVRLSTAVANAPMLRIYADKLGFSPVGRWLRVFQLPPSALADWPAAPLTQITPGEGWQFALTSPSLRAAHQLWTTPDDFTVQAQMTEPGLRRQILDRRYIASRRSGQLTSLLLTAPSGQANSPPGCLHIISALADGDRDLCSGLARAARASARRGLRLAFMIPVPSDFCRRQLITRADAHHAHWTELVLLEKWLVE